MKFVMNFTDFFKRSLLWPAVLCAALAFAFVQSAQAEEATQLKIATSMGDIGIEVYPDKAPKTVANFLEYVKAKHYEGSIFHRVIGSFMIQGGGYDVRFKEKTMRAPVEHEGRAALTAGLKNRVGTLAMARTSEPQSATAQFFINVVDNAFLDPTAPQFGYTVFGKVISGMDVVEKIKATPTGAGGPFRSDVPKTPVIILSISLEPSK